LGNYCTELKAAVAPHSKNNMAKRLLTKTAYGYGLVCDRYFWIYQNEREQLPEADEATQAIFDQGHLIGDMAKSLFPDGMEIDWCKGHEAGIAQTASLLGERRPIFEAGFRHGDAHARADILKPSTGGGWELIEVKSSARVKEEHHHDVAFQKHVYAGAGISIRRCFVMCVDTAYVRKGELEANRLLKLTDVTADIKPLMAKVPPEVKRQLSVMRKPKPPDCSLGSHCSDCPLYDQCWSFLPERHVFSLYRAGQKAFDLMDQGILKINDIPEEYSLTQRQSIQATCERTGEPHIEPKGIQAFLKQLKYPLCFLDFETLMAAVPPYDEMSPYEQVPFQYSLHVVSSPGASVEHHSYLSQGSTDPRPEVLSNLKKQLGSKGSIVAYNSAFETRVLERCVAHFPKYEKWLEAIRPRMVDLYAPFRDFHYYHPDQNGSASLKAVLPVLTGRSYEGFEIADGQAASLRFREMAFGNLEASRKKAIRKALETYCRQDAEGMLGIVNALQRMCQ
jgi:hypothetical protein